MDCCHDMAREASATVAAHYPKTALKAGSTELEAETHPVSSKDEASIGGYVAGQDLVVIALSGVQRFIEESRTTSDLRAGSRIIAELTEQAVSVCEEAAAELVFPAPSPG